MKRQIIRMLSAILLVALATSLVACGNANIYDELGEQGYTVKIRYDAGGAVVNETQNVTIVEVFNEDDVVTTAGGKTGIKLLAPDDPVRGAEGTFKLAKIDGDNNFFQAGWYTKRTPRVDADGNPLDAYGELTSVSGREQGYVYEGKWDFDNDVVDPKNLENGELTLYAAWVPFFTYEFYSQKEDGSFEKLSSIKKLTLLVPTWNERSEKFDMNDFPRVDGKVFNKAYLDGEMTQEITANIDGRLNYTDYEQGIATSTTVNIYITWTDEN